MPNATTYPAPDKHNENHPAQKPVTENEYQSLPWSVNLSETKTVAAGLPSNREYYDLGYDHFFLVDAAGKVQLDYFGGGYMLGTGGESE